LAQCERTQLLELLCELGEAAGSGGEGLLTADDRALEALEPCRNVLGSRWSAQRNPSLAVGASVVLSESTSIRRHTDTPGASKNAQGLTVKRP